MTLTHQLHMTLPTSLQRKRRQALLPLLVALHSFAPAALVSCAISSSDSPTLATQSIVDGSTMIVSGTRTFTGALTDVNLSGLFGSTPASTASSGQPTVVLITPSPSSSAAFASNTSGNAQSSSSSSGDEGPINQSALIGIIVGGIVGLICIAGLCIFLVGRWRKPKKFDRGRGITPSMVISNRGSKLPPSSDDDEWDIINKPSKTAIAPAVTTTAATMHHNNNNNNDYYYHYYNNQQPQQNNNDLHLYYPDAPSPEVLPPSETTTAALDAMYNIKQYNTKQQQRRGRTSAASNGARLSKYNYLAQAFNQMRASYNMQVSAEQQRQRQQQQQQRSFNNRSNDSQQEQHQLQPYNNTPTTTTSHQGCSNDKNSNNHNKPATSVNNNDVDGDGSNNYYLPTNLNPPPRITVSPSEGNTDNNNNLLSSVNGYRESLVSDVSQYSTFSADPTSAPAQSPPKPHYGYF